MRTLTFDEVIGVLKKGFKSFDKPDYASVELQRDSPTISQALIELGGVGDYTNISDSNDDVSIILSSGTSPYLIYLSLVGKVAFVDGNPNTNLVIYNKIIQVLNSLGWNFVDKEVLRLKSPFPTFIAGGNATIFNALFADGYTTP